MYTLYIAQSTYCTLSQGITLKMSLVNVQLEKIKQCVMDRDVDSTQKAVRYADDASQYAMRQKRKSTDMDTRGPTPIP